MTGADKRSFAEALALVGEVFNEPVSEGRIAMYFDALSDLEVSAVLAALRSSVRSFEFFPKPVQVRNLALGSTADRADMAWGEVLEAIRRVGYMGFPAFDDPQIHPAIRSVWGSWTRLCETLPREGPELVGWIKQFKQAYGATVHQSERPTFAQLPESLAGVRAQLEAISGTRRLE